jgi:hypothetical protein
MINGELIAGRLVAAYCKYLTGDVRGARYAIEFALRLLPRSRRAALVRL